MISLELAQKLKDAGLVWEPKAFDWVCTGDEVFPILGMRQLGKTQLYRTLEGYCCCTDLIYMPSLNQLLAEIVARGYIVSIHITKDKSLCVLRDGMEDDDVVQSRMSSSDTPEDAAAKALLYILEGNRND